MGSTTCGGCHAEVAATFRRTGMGRAFYPLAGNIVETFGVTIDIPGQSLRYTLFEKEGRHYQRQFQIDERGRESSIDVREMIYVIGSGNHSRSYITVDRGRLYQMPVCWYPTPGMWDLCPGYELRNEHFQREVDDTCLFCHNGRMEPAGRFGNTFKEPFVSGIDCERCHGPGSAHVARWSTPAGEDLLPPRQHREDRSDDTIVNPRRLPPDLAMHVCMQCHLADAGQSERVVRFEAPFRDYRPGLPLHRFLAVYTYRQKLPGVFGLGAQADRLVLSRCYRESGGRLACTTCHDPHREVYEIAAAQPGRFDDACRSCHAKEACAAPPAQRSGDCVGCHMRRAEPRDQKHTTFTDHWIRRRPDEGLAAGRTDFTMEPLFEETAAREDPAERALHLGRAYYYKKTGSADGRPMPWDLSLASLNEAIRLEPELAPAHFFLGKVEMSRGFAQRAEKHFRRAIEVDSGYVEAHQELGSALLQQGRTEESAVALGKALALGPRRDDEGAVLNEMARVEMQRGRLDEAGRRLEAASEIEPFSPEIHANKGLLRGLQGDTAGAIASLLEALRFAPNHPAIHRHLADALVREGPRRDLKEALVEARRAVELSPGDAGALATLQKVCAAAGRAGCAEPAPSPR